MCGNKSGTGTSLKPAGWSHSYTYLLQYHAVFAAARKGDCPIHASFPTEGELNNCCPLLPHWRSVADSQKRLPNSKWSSQHPQSGCGRNLLSLCSIHAGLSWDVEMDSSYGLRLRLVDVSRPRHRATAVKCINALAHSLLTHFRLF